MKNHINYIKTIKKNLKYLYDLYGLILYTFDGKNIV
ncbi:hypothetical protein SAMN05216297_109181 [Flavobacterium phragmitis]|uniref:Uncharacterized protein n=1 Tax=Flavobacterium phragmitis TaxID=739143 RepID=A0A1I1TIL9_9FLAO|nr:hypothetical protein SAMN05216297_109181 [Flavobacterium phragmitis]